MRKIPEDKKEIIRIAVPAVLESLISVVITTIDTRMISPLGSAAVSAVSMTTQPKLIFLLIFFALGTTASVFVSQALGKKGQKGSQRLLPFNPSWMLPRCAASAM